MSPVLEAVRTTTKKLFAKKGGNSFVGVDIGTSTIKAVQMKKDGGKVILETYGEIALGAYANQDAGTLTNLDPNTLGDAVRDIVEQSNITTNNGIFSIPASASLIRVVELPEVSKRQLADIIPNEARKYIPVPIGEVSLDWWIIPSPRDFASPDSTPALESVGNKIEVLMAAVHNDTIQKQRDIAKASGVNVGSFEIEVFSAIRSTLHHELFPIAVVDFGASGTRIFVVEYGVVKEFHSINRGSHFITESISKSLSMEFAEAEQLKKDIGLVDKQTNSEAHNIIKIETDQMINELNRVVLDFEKRYNKAVGKFILIGGGSRMKGLGDRISESFSFEVSFGNPFEKAGSPQFLDDLLEETGPEFAVAVGLALKNL